MSALPTSCFTGLLSSFVLYFCLGRNLIALYGQIYTPNEQKHHDLQTLLQVITVEIKLFSLEAFTHPKKPAGAEYPPVCPSKKSLQHVCCHVGVSSSRIRLAQPDNEQQNVFFYYNS